MKKSRPRTKRARRLSFNAYIDQIESKVHAAFDAAKNGDEAMRLGLSMIDVGAAIIAVQRDIPSEAAKQALLLFPSDSMKRLIDAAEARAQQYNIDTDDVLESVLLFLGEVPNPATLN